MKFEQECNVTIPGDALVMNRLQIRVTALGFEPDQTDGPAVGAHEKAGTGPA